MDPKERPFLPADARIRIRGILDDGITLLSDHAVHELEADDMDMNDVRNILRGGVVQPAEWEQGEWRYRVVTPRMACVVSFESEKTLTVVTGWRRKDDRGQG